jgi:hypothetical protein
MKDVEDWVPKNHRDENPKELFENYLKEVGFKSFDVEIKEFDTFYTWEEYLGNFVHLIIVGFSILFLQQYCPFSPTWVECQLMYGKNIK